MYLIAYPLYDAIIGFGKVLGNFSHLWILYIQKAIPNWVIFACIALVLVLILGVIVVISFNKVQKSKRIVLKHELEKKVAEVLLKKRERELAFLRSGRGKHLGHFFEEYSARQQQAYIIGKEKDQQMQTLLPYHLLLSSQLSTLYPNFSKDEIQHCVFLYLNIPSEKTAKKLQLEVSEVQSIRCKLRTKVLKSNEQNLKTHVRAIVMN
ncbi:hypothetical protein [Aquimarina spongiae]|uniref:Uncharacterized protein n=1 Tax=Aquimarina spongiae TaxID=570521 RepID=A0A1M6CRK2_9FLAO|nr:hypothetical protein [Aquimarina spongiae]SHI63579.1 hypothetical protein SAMN04488508_102243 [Aquimarina spongiae]